MIFNYFLRFNNPGIHFIKMAVQNENIMIVVTIEAINISLTFLKF